MTDLEQLLADKNNVTDLAPLSGCTALRQLSLAGNPVENLAALKGLAALTDLDVNETGVADLTPLKGCGELTVLRARGNAIADLTPLRGLKKLYYLDVGHNRIVDIAPIVREGLVALDVSYNGLRTLGPLTALYFDTAGLFYFNAAHNRLDTDAQDGPIVILHDLESVQGAYPVQAAEAAAVEGYDVVYAAYDDSTVADNLPDGNEVCYVVLTPQGNPDWSEPAGHDGWWLWVVGGGAAAAVVVAGVLYGRRRRAGSVSRK